MKTTNLAVTIGFLIAGFLPWFTLGPASTLSISGISAGLLPTATILCGAAAGVLSLLALKGMPAKAGGVGPRLGALLLSLVAVSLAIVWLSISGNTQVQLGAETVLLHYGPGAPVALGLSLLSVGLHGYAVVTTAEPLPKGVARTVASLANRVNSRNNRNDDSNRRTTPNKRVVDNRGRGDASMGDRRRGPAPDVHVRPTSEMQTSGRSREEPPESGSGDLLDDLFDRNDQGSDEESSNR